MDSPINLHQLELFCHVVEHRSYIKAAEHLFMTQPALSLQIKSLEKKLNVKLFQRKGNNIHLTKVGEVVYQHAIKVLKLDQQLRLSVQEVASGNVGYISMISNRPIGRYLLPDYTFRFIQQFPNIEVTNSIDNSEQVTKMISDEKADIGFIGVFSEKEIPNQLERFLIYKDYWTLVCKRDSHWTKLKNSNIEYILEEVPIIGSLPNSAHGRIINRNLSSIGMNYNAKIRLDDIESIKMALLSQLGVSFLPRVTIEKELAYGELEEIPISNFESRSLDYYLITKKGVYTTPALEKFINFIKKELKSVKAT